MITDMRKRGGIAKNEAVVLQSTTVRKPASRLSDAVVDKTPLDMSSRIVNAGRHAQNHPGRQILRRDYIGELREYINR